MNKHNPAFVGKSITMPSIFKKLILLWLSMLITFPIYADEITQDPQSLKTAAEKGDAQAEMNYGKYFLDVKNNTQEAAVWIRKSAEQGLPEAIYYLGYAGIGKEPPVYYYEQAAQKGYVPAFDEALGDLFFNADSHPDIKKAKELTDLARKLKIDSQLNSDLGTIDICYANLLQNLTFPTQDLPSPTDKKSLADCSSKNLYYGIGVPVDYVKARKCAFIEEETAGSDNKANNLSVFSGSSILMMIYANGYGVKPNLDMAIKLACTTDSAPAEYSGRINHLISLKTKPEKEPFDFCDDITSGAMSGACADRDHDIAANQRNDKIAQVISTWPKNQQTAFKTLQQAAQRYFEARTGNEGDQSGTASGQFAAIELGKLESNFLKSFKTFEEGGLPHYSANDFQRLDKQLNVTYQKVINNPDFSGSSSDMSGITKSGIESTEKLWLLYRDAWVAFAAIRYPSISANSWKAWLTKERIEQLKEVPF